MTDSLLKAFIFDTETTGLIPTALRPLDQQPYITEFYGSLVDFQPFPVRCSEVHHLLKPPIPIPDDLQKKIGITNDMVTDCPSFADVADEIANAIESAPMIIAHNISYDVEIVGFEFERLGRKLNLPPQLCTVEQTIHLTGKRLTLTELHVLLTGTSFVAHRAHSDVEAIVRCVEELLRRNEL